MTPHMCKSSIYRGLWMCVAKRVSRDPRRAYEPVPNARIIYGATPHAAYTRWKEYHTAAVQRGEIKGGSNVGSA